MSVYLSPFFPFQLGRGIFAKRDLAPGVFLVEYAGEVIDEAEAERREKAVPSVFRFFFEFNDKTTW